MFVGINDIHAGQFVAVPLDDSLDGEPAHVQTELGVLLEQVARSAAERAWIGAARVGKFQGEIEEAGVFRRGKPPAGLAARCGQIQKDLPRGHSWGYTEPTEAAWQLLDEAVEPFVEDMKRHLGLGLHEEAFEICKGVVLGLYQCRDAGGDEFLGWAEDFPAEAAGNAVTEWIGAGKTRLFRQAARAESCAPSSGICGQTRSRVAVDLQTGCW